MRLFNSLNTKLRVNVIYLCIHFVLIFIYKPSFDLIWGSKCKAYSDNWLTIISISLFRITFSIASCSYNHHVLGVPHANTYILSLNCIISFTPALIFIISACLPFLIYFPLLSLSIHSIWIGYYSSTRVSRSTPR